MTEQDIWSEIRGERRYQDDKWGSDPRDYFVLLAVMTEEVGEVAQAINDGKSLPDLRAELVQVAAVAVKMIEQIDSEEG